VVPCLHRILVPRMSGHKGTQSRRRNLQCISNWSDSSIAVHQQLERQLRHLEHMELQSSRTSISPDGRNPPKSAEFSQHVLHLEQDTEHLIMRPQHPIMQATQQLTMPPQQIEQLMVPASVQVRAPPVPQEPPQPDQFQHNPFEVSPSEEQQQQQLQEAVQCEMQQLIQQQRQQQQALIEQQERDRISMLTMKQQQVSYTPTQNNARHVDARTNASTWNTCLHRQATPRPDLCVATLAHSLGFRF